MWELVIATGKQRMMTTLTITMVTVMAYDYYMVWSSKEANKTKVQCHSDYDYRFSVIHCLMAAFVDSTM